jgi:ATP-dependent DNA ligase
MKFPTLYSKTASGNINFWEIWTEGFEVKMKWGQVGTTSPQTDSYLAAGKNAGRANATTPEEQAIKEAQAKFDKQLRLKYCRTIEEAENGLNIKPMRAYTLDDKRAAKIEWPATAQPKFNGVRCLAYNLPDGSVRLMSRGGKDYMLKHIQDELKNRIPKGRLLDGELYAHGFSLQTQRHFIETPCTGTRNISLVVYDFTVLEVSDTEWVDRSAQLLAWFSQNKDLQHVRMSPAWTVNNLGDLDRLHDGLVQEGYEGAMLRTSKGTYKFGAKSTQLLKYKKFQDAEFEVVSWSVGRDGVIVYKCVQEDGEYFEVRPTGNQAERAELLKQAESAIGQKLTVRFQERSDDNIPIFPVGIGLRPEKDMD